MAAAPEETADDTSYGTPSVSGTRTIAEAPTFRTDERLEKRRQKEGSRKSVEQTLQYRTQLSSGQDVLMRACYNPRTSHLLTADARALRLWSLRREIRSFTFRSPVRLINVHYAASIDRYVCLYVEMEPLSSGGADGAADSSRTTSKSEWRESEHASLQVFLPTLVSQGMFYLTRPGFSSAADANNSGDIVTSAMFQSSSELVTGSRSGDVSVWHLRLGPDDTVKAFKMAGVILEGAVALVSVNEDTLHIAAAGVHKASCIEYTPGDAAVAAGGKSSASAAAAAAAPTMVKTHDYMRAGVSADINITALEFLDRTTRVLLGYSDGAVFAWDFPEQPLKVRERPGLHTGAVTSLVNLPGNGDYFSCGEDGKVAHWSLYVITYFFHSCATMIVTKYHQSNNNDDDNNNNSDSAVRTEKY